MRIAMLNQVFRALALGLFLWFGCGAAARADSCSAKMTDVVFANVSPIAGSDYYANGTLTVNCTLVLGLPNLVLPNITYCISLGIGSGGASGAWRTMAAGSTRLPYNLFTAASQTQASVWGGAAMPSNMTPIRETVLAGLLALGTYSRSYTIYGRIPASGLVGVGTSGNGDTVYTSAFSADATLTYAFSTLVGTPSCTSGTTTTIPFQVRATVVNNCVISASDLAFGNSNLLTSVVRVNTALSVQCTANNAYRIALNGGVNGTVAARRMRNPVTGETVAYAISGTPGGPPWGDGSAGTTMVSGTGNGAVQNVPLYSSVPAQPTPAPGDYKDTVTATVYF